MKCFSTDSWSSVTVSMAQFIHGPVIKSRRSLTNPDQTSKIMYILSKVTAPLLLVMDRVRTMCENPIVPIVDSIGQNNRPMR